MFVAFVLALALSQATVAPPPVNPPIMVTNSPPPPVIMAPVPPPMIRPAPTVTPPSATLDVRLMQGRELLWEGPLRVGKEAGIVTYSISQTEEAACPASTDWERSVRSTYSLRISRVVPSENGDRFRVNASRMRTAGPCTSSGTSGLQLDKPFEVRSGQTVEVSGEAELKLVVKRR